jgi:ubiquinone/menaquinone biosynthesis C-methylase UbiE
MEIKYKQEADLLQHYNNNVNYSSPIIGNMENILSLYGDPHYPMSAKVLDVGCGAGHASKYIRDRYKCTVIGIDYSEKRIDLARKDSDCEFIVCDVNHVLKHFKDDYFDLIMAFETLEHLVDPSGVLHKCKRVLKPNGMIIGSVPLNHPYVAHIHVYSSAQDVENQLGVEVFHVVFGRYAFFKTGKT